MEFSLNGVELSLNSKNLRNHWGMNWVQYKDLLCCLWLCGWVVESLSLTQKILGSNPAIFLLDLKNFFAEFSENIWRKLHYSRLYVLMRNMTSNLLERSFLKLALFVSCTTTHVGLCSFLESIEHDCIKAFMIQIDNQKWLCSVGRSLEWWPRGCGAIFDKFFL